MKLVSILLTPLQQKSALKEHQSKSNDHSSSQESKSTPAHAVHAPKQASAHHHHKGIATLTPSSTAPLTSLESTTQQTAVRVESIPSQDTNMPSASSSTTPMPGSAYKITALQKDKPPTTKLLMVGNPNRKKTTSALSSLANSPHMTSNAVHEPLKDHNSLYQIEASIQAPQALQDNGTALNQLLANQSCQSKPSGEIPGPEMSQSQSQERAVVGVVCDSTSTSINYERQRISTDGPEANSASSLIESATTSESSHMRRRSSSSSHPRDSAVNGSLLSPPDSPSMAKRRSSSSGSTSKRPKIE